MFGQGKRNNWRRLDVRRRFVVWMTRRGLIRLTVVSALVFLIAAVYVSEIPSARTWTYWTLPLSGKVIALDAGHGGPDGGAVSRDGAIEKDLNLAIVLYLRDYLQQAGALVLLTREGDYDLAAPGTRGYSKRKTEDLLERAERVGSRRVNLALSLHMNSIPSPKWSGAQTFYHSGNEASGKLAADIQAEIRESLGNTSRVPKPKDDMYLLKMLKMPTVLVEVGFLSHPEEARLLSDESYQRRMAAAIYRGILKFAASEDGRSL